jgi:hypothetical protein
MKLTSRFLLAAGLLALVPFAAHAKIERTVEKTFTVQPGGTLRIDTQGGEIRVAPSADLVVKITAREKIRASTEAEADDLLKKLDLTFEQSGSDVTASAKYERQLPGFHWGSWPPVQVDFIVTVPASFATDLHTSGGDVVVGDLAGKVHARTSGGNIRLGKIGADIDAHTSGGNVSLDEGRGAVKLGTSGGDISVGHAAGPAELSTSGGAIKIESVENAVHASTSGGNVRAGINGPLKDDCVLSTSGGTVKVTVDKAAAFRLDASTSGGEVDAEGLTITIESSNRGHSRLAGAVNGGGPLLKLRSSGGDIVVRTR